MTVEVSWSGLKKAAREGSWVFEVVPIKGQPFDESAFDEAVEAANEIHQAEIERFEDANLVWRFASVSGVGFWCEYELSGKQVEDFIGVFVTELEQRGLVARIRAVRQSDPEAFLANWDGICVAIQINGCERPKPHDSLFDWQALGEDREAVVGMLLDWCSFENGKYWVQHGMSSMSVPAESRIRLGRQFAVRDDEFTRFVAESPAGDYRAFVINEEGLVFVSIGHAKAVKWRESVDDAVSVIRSIAPHIQYAGVSRSITNQRDFNSWAYNVWIFGGEERGKPQRVRLRERHSKAALILGVQLLGPGFAHPEAKPGWTVEDLGDGRVLLLADDREAWFAQPATQELMREAEELYPGVLGIGSVVRRGSVS